MPSKSTRDRLELEPAGLQRLGVAPSSTGLPPTVAVIGEQARGQIERLLRARGRVPARRHLHRARRARYCARAARRRHIAAFLAVIEQVSMSRLRQYLAVFFCQS